MSKIILFHGDKGGVGKSFAASVYLDRELVAGRAPIVIDSDVRNPDTMRMFQDQLECKQIDLAAHGGWMELYDVMEDNPDTDVVVSLPSQIGIVIKEEGDELGSAVQAMKRKMVLVWPINRAADSVYLLKLALEDIHGIDHALVLKNGFFGGTKQFYRWDHSNTKKDFTKKGYVEAFLPELHERITDKIGDAHLPYSVALKDGKFKIADRMTMEKWIRNAHIVFASLDDV